MLTRVGNNSKCVISGDFTQIDEKFLDETNNALSIAINKFKSVELVGSIILKKSERSRLAEISSELLNK